MGSHVLARRRASIPTHRISAFVDAIFDRILNIAFEVSCFAFELMGRTFGLKTFVIDRFAHSSLALARDFIGPCL